MPIVDNVHTDRARAESFGSVAEQYDRYRPSYPDDLISDLVQLDPARTLDIACGTGKVAVTLLACGLAVLGVEIDPQMAAVARSHGIVVEVGAFETWDDLGRTFDLITCGQGWHWIDPVPGAAKAAGLLNPGGTLALFWNYLDVEARLQQAFEGVYARYAPHLARPAHSSDEDAAHVEVLQASGRFATVETKRYSWNASLTAQEWIGRAATHSDHICLPDDQRTALLDALHAAIDANGGVVTADGWTYTIFARTSEG